MKRFILLIALSALFYSAPGYTGGKDAETQTAAEPTAPEPRFSDPHIEELDRLATKLIEDRNKAAFKLHEAKREQAAWRYGEWGTQPRYDIPQLSAAADQAEKDYDQAQREFSSAKAASKRGIVATAAHSVGKFFGLK